jgi:peptidoglycan/xylan/chitin deacetylase (PgdA/CDA1 family)
MSHPSLEGNRDFVGYGRNPPNPQWVGNARIAVNFNLNFEGGGERSLDNGDLMSEALLNDIGFPALQGVHSPLTESVFEFGSRCGVWRLLRIFDQFEIKVSVLAVVQAMERNLDAVNAFIEAGHEIVSHGYRWIDYQLVPEAIEAEHIHKAIAGIESITGQRPQGWMTGRPSQNTRKLLFEAGGILYDRDSLGDELPYWVTVKDQYHLVIPYSYETNDNRFNENTGFSTADDFFHYMKDCFDLLYSEGAEHPKLMSIGLHDRLIGRPGRAVGLIRLLDYMQTFDDVWFCRGIDIAQHWQSHHPAPAS